MLVVAGSVASGKTSIFFRLHSRVTQIDSFNVDDRGAALNDGSYRAIPPAVVARASRECEEFVRLHIAERRSFMVETTLRSGVALDQALEARRAGFVTEMVYVTTNDPEINVQRAAIRELGGGRATSRASSTCAALSGKWTSSASTTTARKLKRRASS